jgi:hypothetical protein
MRRIFWGGVVAAVCMAAGTYFAAECVHRHPDSAFAVCTTRACQAAAACNPLAKLAQVLLSSGYQPCDARAPVAAGGCEECEPPDSPEPVDVGLDSLAGIDPVLPPLCWPEDQGNPTCPSLLDATLSLFRTPPMCDDPEECEDVHAGKPPACREAPEASRQYPCCEPIAAPKKACPPDCAAEEEQEYELIPPPKPLCPCAGCCEGCCKPCPKCPASDGCPEGCDKCPKAGEPCKSKPKIDTLEFRPTDAKKGEFDPIPF